jgi:hypothetical protein
MTRRSRIWVLTIAFFMSLAVQASFLPFPAHAGRLKGFHTFKVVDANGKVIGIAATPGGTGATLVFEVGGQVFSLAVGGDGFNEGGSFVFESPDTTCSGTPLLQVYPPALLTQVVIAPPGTTVYAPDPSAVPQTISVGSMQFFPGGSCSSFCFPVCPTGSVVPVIALVDLDTQFTPPFKVKP